jgi:hypothetical protein
MTHVKGTRWTYEEAKEFIEVESQSGCKLLSKEYINQENLLELQCSCGEYFKVSFANFISSKRQCNNCSKRKRLTFEEIKKYIEIDSNSGCKLLSYTFENNDTPLLIQCKCGNIYESNFGRFRHSNNIECRECSIKTQHIIKWNKENIIIFLNNLGFIIDMIDGEGVKAILTFHDNEGYKYKYKFQTILMYKNARKIYHTNKFTLYNINLWCKLNDKPFQLISTEWKGSSSKLQWKCLKEDCGEIFEMNWGDISQGHGCGYCSGKQVGMSNCLATKNPELAKEWHPTKNGDLTPYDITSGSCIKIWWLCPECGNEWEASNDKRHGSNRGCPRCNYSSGEKQIEYILNSASIYNVSQKTFDDLRGVGNGLLSYDFYLPYYNLLIEFQGEQHERPFDYFGGEEKFIIQQEHDRLKRLYALDNNINLLEIWYYDFDRIKEILHKKLQLGL